VIKSSRKRWANYAASKGREILSAFQLVNTKERGWLEDLGANGRIILKLILNEKGTILFFLLKTRTNGGPL
jgi:hypothetical protein